MKNQREIILEHILNNGSITSIEAFQLYKITRISAVIYNLRHDEKLKINMKREKFASPEGRAKSFGIYSLAP